MRRNRVWVVEERIRGEWFPLCVDVSENIAAKMMASLREFDLSNEERYRLQKYGADNS